MGEINAAGVKLAREAAGGARVRGGFGGADRANARDALARRAAQHPRCISRAVRSAARRGRRRLHPGDLPPARRAEPRDHGGSRGERRRADHRLRVVRRGGHHRRRACARAGGRAARRLGERRHRRELRHRPGRRLRDAHAHARAEASPGGDPERRHAAAHRGPARVHGDARVLPDLRAPAVQGRRERGGRLLRHHARAHPQDRRCGAHGRGRAGERGGLGWRHARRQRATAARGGTGRRGVLPTAEKGELGKKSASSSGLRGGQPAAGSASTGGGERAHAQARGVDIINVADGPRARHAWANLALCLRIQQEVGRHADARHRADRNLLGRWRTGSLRTSWACATSW